MDIQPALDIFKYSQDSVFAVDPETGVIIHSNPKATEDTNFEPQELSGLEFKQLFMPEEQDSVVIFLKSTSEFKTGFDPQRVVRRKTGRKIFVEMSASSIEIGGRKIIISSLRDTTARVKAEEKLKKYNLELEQKVKERTAELASANETLKGSNTIISRQKKELEDVMANIRQAVFTIAPDMKINSEHSKSVNEIFGIEQAGGVDICEFLKNNELKESLGLFFASPDTWDLLQGLLPKDLLYKKTDRELLLEWCPILDAGTAIKMMVVCSDVTEKNRLQREIAKSEEKHSEQLEILAHLISLPTQIATQFVTDMKRLIAEVKDQFTKLADAPGSIEDLKNLMRSMHTIKGLARQCKFRTAQGQAHTIETGVTKHLEGKGVQTPPLLEMRGMFEELEKNVMTALEFVGKVFGGAASSDTESIDVLRVPLKKIERLLDVIPRRQSVITPQQLRFAVKSLYRLPAKTLFDRLENLATELAKERGREIIISRYGDDLGVDYRILTNLYEALLHSIRNSIDHGGEPVDGGRLELKLSVSAPNDDFLAFEIVDNGKGIDVEKVRKKVIEKGLVSAEEAGQADHDTLVNYVFLPGFSTRDVVTELSGRGFGMDIVKQKVEHTLGGRAVLRSEVNKGTRLMALVPAEVCLPDSAFVASVSEERVIADIEHTIESKLKRDAVASDSIVICDKKRLGAVKEAGASMDRIICLDALKPAGLVTELIGQFGVRHFIDRVYGSFNSYGYGHLRATLNKIRGKEIWGLKPYLMAGSPMFKRTIMDFSEKNTVIDEVLSSVSGVKAFAGFRDLVATIADEFIMNGMFDAPRGSDGKEKYNHLPRTHRLVLEENESVILSYGHDSMTLGLSIEDKFGALTYETIAKYLKKIYSSGGISIEQKLGGAGLGLSMIFNGAQFFVVNVQPGKRTEMIALVPLVTSYKEYQECGKSFSFYQAA
ncbi:MAG: PAS domain S-box protein [Bdellovibrionota bacterium]